MWRTLHELLRANARLQQERHNLFVPLVRDQGDGDDEVMELPDGTGVFEKRYWRLRPVQEEGQVELPTETEEEIPSGESEDIVDTEDLFAVDTGRSALSQKLRISSSAPAETTVRPERTLPRIRNVNDLYHPWDPFKVIQGERKRRIAEMRRRGRKKAKRAKKDPAVLPAQAAPDSAVPIDASQSIDQGEASDSQMVDHILQQLESTSGTESSRPAPQSSLFEDQTNVPDPDETTAAKVEFSHPETPTATADSSEISARSSLSHKLQSTRPALSQITTEEQRPDRLEIETESADTTEPTTKEEFLPVPEIPSQASSSIEIMSEDETPQTPSLDETSGREKITSTTPQVEAPSEKRRGRPKGSKNRPKD
jgi:hypothetical protein